MTPPANAKGIVITDIVCSVDQRVLLNGHRLELLNSRTAPETGVMQRKAVFEFFSHGQVGTGTGRPLGVTEAVRHFSLRSGILLLPNSSGAALLEMDISSFFKGNGTGTIMIYAYGYAY